MEKVYQPVVLKICNNILSVLKEDGFFDEFDNKELSYPKALLCDLLTEKFIAGELDENGVHVFTTDEMQHYLNMVMAEDTLRSLMKKGLVTSYEDENTEEIFFLTELGKSLKTGEINYDDFNSSSGSLE